MSTATKSVSAPTYQPTSRGSGFIIGPIADSVLIIGAPLVALVLGGSLFALPSSRFQVSLKDEQHDVRQILIAAFVSAHLILVYFRSHGNQNIFWTYPYRFTVVPLGMIALGAMSASALGIMGLVVTWWDVYHSSLQTFGFGR